MIAGLVFLFAVTGQTTTTPNVADYFPLVPGTRWIYTDDSLGGSESEETVLAEVTVPSNTAKEPDRTFFPIKRTFNGEVVGWPCYKIKGSTVYQVGNGPHSPIEPRPILKIGKGKVQWEFFSDPSSAIDPVSVAVKASCEAGKPQELFGKLRNTYVVTMDASAGGKAGLEVSQISTYAEGIGLVDFTETGAAGGKAIRQHRQLVEFHPATEAAKG